MDGFGAIHHGWDNFKKYKKSYPVLGERDEKDKKSEEEEGKEAHRGGDQRAEGKQTAAWRIKACRAHLQTSGYILVAG